MGKPFIFYRRMATMWRINRLSKTVNTPWGVAHDINPVCEGVDFLSTPSHGGYRLSEEKNRKVKQEYRDPTGFYEEDCEWAFVCVTYPEIFPPGAVDSALKTIARYYPLQTPVALTALKDGGWEEDGG